jgi:transmembrane sensor
MSESKNTCLLEKFLAGTATDAEEAQLREWAENTLSYPGTVDLLRASWERPYPSPVPDRDARWLSLQEKIGLGLSSAVPPVTVRVSKYRRFFTSRAISLGAIVAIFLVGIGGIWTAKQHNRVSDELLNEYVTLRGQRATIQLADGSSVTLAPETKLRFFTKHSGNRRAELEGEAIFSVNANSHTPFVVHAGNTLTRVLGTEFGVRRYSEDSSVRVVVTSGRVAVQSATDIENGTSLTGEHETGDRVVLSMNEIVHVTASGALHKTQKNDLNGELGWRTGHHVFRETPASIVASELGRAYDLDIQFADADLGERLLTLSFTTERESIMLDILVKAMLNVQAERHGRTVILSRIPSQS